MSTHIVSRQVELDAHPARVWHALTTPSQTREYFFGCEVHSTWAVGSPITFTGKMLYIIPITLNGTILEIDPGKLLKYSLKHRSDEGGSVVTMMLVQCGQNTILSVRDDVGDSAGADKRLRKSEKGWDKVLRGLRQLLENRK